MCRSILPLDLTLADLAREVVHDEGLIVDVVSLLDVLPPLDKPLYKQTDIAKSNEYTGHLRLCSTQAKSALYLAAPALGLAVQVVAPALASVRIDAMLAKFGCVYG